MSCPPDNIHHLANISKGATIGLVIVVLTLWDQIEKIKNKMLLGSIMAYTTLMFIAMISASFAWEHAAKGEFERFANIMVLVQSTYVAAFTCLVFHSAYRAALILAPRSPHTFKIGLFGAFTQMCIHIPASSYWGLNMTSTYGAGISPISQKLEIVVLVYYSVVESSLYLLTQHRIISVKSAASSAASTKVKFILYAKGFLRAGAYSINVILIYLTLGNRLPQNQTMNWQYPLYGPVLILMILLTDSGRFQQCIEKLSGTATHGSSTGKNPTGSVMSKGTERNSGMPPVQKTLTSDANSSV